MYRSGQHRKLALLLAFGLGIGLASIGQAQPADGPGPPAHLPLLPLGPGDEVTVHVFGQPNMDGTMYIADDGTVQLPLAGPVHVAGLSPSEAAHAVEAALREKQILVSPHVTFTILKSTSQQVSVLGEVRNSGIFPIQSNSTLLELLAQAGGETDQGADTIFILRPGPDGVMRRLAVNLQGLAEAGTTPEAAEFTMKGGDQVYVPRAAQVFVTGEVRTPGRFRIDPGMTVLEALAHAGGVTNMGSSRRISIRREERDGRYRKLSGRLTDKVKPNDVITVRERIF
jgi:polysaccharide export outer membrane protein